MTSTDEPRASGNQPTTRPPLARLFRLRVWTGSEHISRSGSGIARWHREDWSRRCVCGAPWTGHPGGQTHNSTACRGEMPVGPDTPLGMDCDPAVAS